MKTQTNPSAAQRPREISGQGWKAILSRVGSQVKADHLQIASAGVAFYSFLALFPAIAVLVSLYGLFVDSAHVEEQIGSLASVLPQQGQEIIAQIGQRVAGRSG